MSVIVVFLLVLACLAGWWLSRQGLMSKPWLEQGVVGHLGEQPTLPAERIALVVFLAVVGALFALFASAYFMRMELPDWRSLPVSRVLWLNTGILVLSSAALQCAVFAARRRQADTLKLALVTGGISALTFLAGQLFAWQELFANGDFLADNPANSFFYLLTGMHGLHILGGLVALARVTAKAWDGPVTDRLQLSTELCATYWHFLLFVWFGLFVLLAGWAADFIDICRQLLT
ncbi:MAG: cytochrome c oxidase subunit 3 [Rhizobiaceae bacterium]|nr:cytochrome c oxidase subunit 3 [Rhizobiaceae bacterium]MCV0407081.1 cytochrome c oxidase subunit 3 [Rhizobiaceae bacterium]